MGIKNLNTTAYHPQCDGMVERFNRTLKTILRKHATTYGNQCVIFMVFYMPTGMCPMNRQVKNLHASCLEWTVGHHQKQHTPHLQGCS